MRYLIIVIVYALLENPLGVSAQNTSPATSQGVPRVDATSKGETHTGCQKSELALVGKKG